MPITLHANSEPLLKHILSQPAATLLVLWSANGNSCSYFQQGYFQGQFVEWPYLPMELSGHNRARCTVNRKDSHRSTRKVFLENAVVELVYKFDEKSYCKCLKRWVNRYGTIIFFFGPQTHMW